jgi:hypothetical protein
MCFACVGLRQGCGLAAWGGLGKSGVKNMNSQLAMFSKFEIDSILLEWFTLCLMAAR